MTLTYQGTLSDLADRPVSGTRRIVFSLYTRADGGEAVWSETLNEVDVFEGQFTAVLGLRTALLKLMRHTRS